MRPSLRPARGFALLLLGLGLLPLAGAGRLAGAGGPDLGAVRQLLRQDDPSARAAALRRLAGCDDPAALRLLLEGLDDEHAYVRAAAGGVLGTLAPPGQARVVVQARRLKAPRARAALARAAALWTSERGRALLRSLLEDGHAEVRAAALGWVAEEPDAEALALLRGALADSDGLLRALAIDALVAAGAAEGVAWSTFLADADARVRLASLEGSVAQLALSSTVGSETAVVAVLRGSTDAVWSIRLRAAELSPQVPDRRLLPALITMLEDPRLRVREAAHGALVGITGIPFDPEPGRWTAWWEGDGQTFVPPTLGRGDDGGDAGAHGPGPVPGPGAGPGAGGARPPPGRLEGRTVARPRFLDLPLASRHLAFVLDASGSMARRSADGRRRWEVIVAELDRALGTLLELPGEGAAEVNVILFADEVESLFPAAKKLTRARRAAIRAHLEARHPAGATALFDGIAAALEDASVDTLVVLSDGAPSAGQFFTKTDLLREVGRRNRFRRARIDVIQVGRDGIARRWRDVLARLSGESGGQLVQR